MATERTAPPMAPFFKFTREGQKVAGEIIKYTSNNNGAMIVIRPALLRDSTNEKMRCYRAVTVGLSTDMVRKVGANDVGQYVSIEWTDSKPTAKSPQKIFTVHILDKSELRELAALADMSTRDTAYPGRDRDLSKPADDDDKDELPF